MFTALLNFPQLNAFSKLNSIQLDSVKTLYKHTPDEVLDVLHTFGVTETTQTFTNLFYTSPLSDIVKKFNLSYHFYADDSQLYLSFQPTIPGDRALAVSNIERCVHEIDHWMLDNRLKLIKDKIELHVISAKHLPRPVLQEISDVKEIIRSAQKARNIGVIFDNRFHFNDHIARICKSFFYHLRNINYIRK